jgi:ferredoxin
MADRSKRLPENVEGEFFVDSTCIDCDTCRQLAPATFRETGNYPAVLAQPRNPGERRSALRALVACPTGSIGARGSAREVASDFPLLVEDEVYYCGFNSVKSYGGNSYFVRHPEGNWLIDSPRFTAHLVRRFHEMGGIRYIFLTHRDDIADARNYAGEFGSIRFIHRKELAAQPDAEQVMEGFDPIRLAPDFLTIPTPGHTPGHCGLLHRGAFLFTGDHLWWSRERRALSASREVC